MHKYCRRGLSNAELDCGLDRLLLAERPHNAEVLAYVAEIGARGLFRAAGYSSVYAYLMGRWHLSESAAHKRARSARAARKFPALFDAVADGRLHMSGIATLAEHLTPANVDELVAAATHKSRREIEQIVAERFPRPDMPTKLRALPAPSRARPVAETIAAAQSATAQTCPDASLSVEPSQVVANTSSQLSLATVGAPREHSSPGPADRASVFPTAPQRFALQLTISGATRDKLRRAQELLGYEVAPNDVATVLDLALDALVRDLERKKCARAKRPRQAKPAKSENPRRIPAELVRQVRKRDRDQCGFVGDSGNRCTERKALEIHHVQEVARGGEARLDNLGLRCRAHNQLEAERTFGQEFMRRKIDAATAARALARGSGP